MGLRETINEHQKVSMAVVACVVVAGIIAIAIELKGDNGGPPTKNYFSADDGKTWFVDSTKKLPPFDYQGGKAVRAYVFKGPSGKFVGLLEKYDDGTLAQLSNKPAGISTAEPPVLVKKPGEKDWQPMDSTTEALTLLKITGAEDSGIERLMP